MVGEIAENFKLRDQMGNNFNLYQNLNQKILLIFYPKDNTPVCTRQLSDYQLNQKSFNELGIKLVGINADSEDMHQNFAEKCSLNFQILSDPEKKVCRKFKAVNLFGGIKRKLVLINTDRKIIFEDEVLPVKYRTANHLKTRILNLE